MEIELGNSRQLQLLAASDDCIDSESNSLATAYTDLEVVSAGFFLFEFARHNRQNKVVKTIQTLSPNNELSVIRIEVETLQSQDSERSKAPKGLPGPLAQDVYMALMGMHIEALGKAHPNVVREVKEKGVIPSSIPHSTNKVYFKIKSLAERLGINPRNSRIADALDHLRRTRIKISGTVFKTDGQELKVSLDTNYITALSVFRSIRDRNDETQWHSAEFSQDIVKNVLSGLITRVNNDKMKMLASGPTRRLYQMLSSKRYMFRSREIPLAKDEIISLLGITEKTFAKASKKYFGDLLNAKVIDGFTIRRIGSEPYYVFSMVDDDHSLLPGITEATGWFLEKMQLLGEAFPDIKRVLVNPTFDLNERVLFQLLKQYPATVEFNHREYHKVFLWADMLIFSQARNGGINSITNILRARLEKDLEPDVRGTYTGFLDRLFEIEAERKAREKFQVDQNNKKQKSEAVHRKVEETFERLKASGRLVTFIADIKKKVFGDAPAFALTPHIGEAVAKAILRTGIENGTTTKDLSEMIEIYKKANRKEDAQQTLL